MEKTGRHSVPPKFFLGDDWSVKNVGCYLLLLRSLRTCAITHIKAAQKVYTKGRFLILVYMENEGSAVPAVVS